MIERSEEAQNLTAISLDRANNSKEGTISAGTKNPMMAPDNVPHGKQ